MIFNIHQFYTKEKRIQAVLHFTWNTQESLSLWISVGISDHTQSQRVCRGGASGRRPSPWKDTVNTKPRQWRSASPACSRCGCTSSSHTCRGRCWSPTLRPGWRWSQTPGSDELRGQKGKSAPFTKKWDLPDQNQAHLLQLLGLESHGLNSRTTETPVLWAAFRWPALTPVTTTGFPRPSRPVSLPGRRPEAAKTDAQEGCQ